MARRGKFSDARYDEIKKEILFMFEETDTDSTPIDCFEIARRLPDILIANAPATLLMLLLQKNRRRLKLLL